MDLLSHFRRGLVPGPHESEEAFLLRASKRTALAEWNEIPPLNPEWGFRVDWVPLEYSSKKLRPWEGAIFWEGPRIQLHPSLQKGKLFGNTREDLLHHESVHAAREAFNEPLFEEVLAYSASRSSWKRFWGPLFERSWEFPLFAILAFLLPFIPFFAGALLLLFLGRLLYKQVLFSKRKRNYPFSVLVCLTDQEIRSQKPLMPDDSPRGRLIKLLLNLH